MIITFWHNDLLTVMLDQSNDWLFCTFFPSLVANNSAVEGTEHIKELW